jgi:DNA polymerase IV
MDAFYASVEQHDDPRLRGKPVIVGGLTRGVVLAASYEVRPFGVHSAMPVRQALALCPQALRVRPRMQRYQEVSQQVFAILRAVTPLVQGLSLDEAFLDVSASIEPAAAIARSIKEQIRARTGVTASVGVAPNKLVAKIASDLAKPDGLTIVEPDRVNAVLDPLSVRRLPGLGRKTGARVEALGIATLGELRRAPDALLRPLFGRYTARLRERASGIDEHEVSAEAHDRSISAEDTFERDIADGRELRSEVLRLADRATERLRARALRAGCVAVKIRRADFATFTRQSHLAPPVCDRRTVGRVAGELLERWLSEHRGAKLRLLGVALRQLTPATQLGLFDGARPSADAAIDAVHGRFGIHALRRASSIK